MLNLNRNFGNVTGNFVLFFPPTKILTTFLALSVLLYLLLPSCNAVLFVVPVRNVPLMFYREAKCVPSVSPNSNLLL